MNRKRTAVMSFGEVEGDIEDFYNKNPRLNQDMNQGPSQYSSTTWGFGNEWGGGYDPFTGNDMQDTTNVSYPFYGTGMLIQPTNSMRGRRNTIRGRGFHHNSRKFEKKVQEKPSPMVYSNPPQMCPPPPPPNKPEDPLPAELTSMFDSLKCNLCQVKMTSNVMATTHYKSKNHEKNIRKFLVDYSLRTGTNLHPRALQNSTTKKSTETDKDPKYFYCSVCDLPLTGKLHAESHYSGKNHNAVMMGRKAPAGKGHYDQNGKWIRDTKEVRVLLKEGEDNFGLAFRTNQVAAIEPKSNFTCSICNVSCTCQEQINTHFNGAKHRKKLKTLGLSVENFQLLGNTNYAIMEPIPTPVPPPTVLLTTAPELIPVPQIFTINEPVESTITIDFSKYRTPSGSFYCEKCNISVNSESQLKTHLKSKNHLKKVNKI